MSQPMPTTEAYPAPQVAMTTERQVNAADNLKQQDETATDSMLRLRGGGCVKGCLETICCCCALEAIWRNR
ncbi:hypothetical protein [Absidia glauca]|uniref:Cysteine-rich transmembrane CYSTM domain-containing protein n=1 Tax=Absidia glauca TaxID=4829 RepID=A0A168RYP8_ABSGL|nr:hypothetical protein [Absidia glauca]